MVRRDVDIQLSIKNKSQISVALTAFVEQVITWVTFCVCPSLMCPIAQEKNDRYLYWFDSSTVDAVARRCEGFVSQMESV